MERLNEILKELGISKVKLAKCLGVSRQMIYNYLELDDINKWPKDKKVILFNLLGIKSADELDNLKVNTDYIMAVETRINNLFENTQKNSEIADSNIIFSGLNEKSRTLLKSIINELKDSLSDENDEDAYNSAVYLYNYLKAMDGHQEFKYILAYISKVACKTKPDEFVYDKEKQYILEAILYLSMTLYKNKSYSESKIIAAHKRFVEEIQEKTEVYNSRTWELNRTKLKAMQELGITEVTTANLSEFLAKVDELSRQ